MVNVKGLDESGASGFKGFHTGNTPVSNKLVSAKEPSNCSACNRWLSKVILPVRLSSLAILEFLN